MRVSALFSQRNTGWKALIYKQKHGWNPLSFDHLSSSPSLKALSHHKTHSLMRSLFQENNESGSHSLISSDLVSNPTRAETPGPRWGTFPSPIGGFVWHCHLWPVGKLQSIAEVWATPTYLLGKQQDLMQHCFLLMSWRKELKFLLSNQYILIGKKSSSSLSGEQGSSQELVRECQSSTKSLLKHMRGVIGACLNFLPMLQ